MARILFVNKASLAYPGGAETRIRAVASRMAAAGHAVFLICAKTSPGEPREENLEGVHVRRVSVLPEVLLRRFPPPSYLPQALFYLLAFPIIWRSVREWRIDAIRDDMSPFPGLSLLAPLLGPKAIVVVHNLFGGLSGWRRFYSLPFAMAGALGELALLRGWLRYRFVVTAAPWVATYVQSHGPHAPRVASIPNGVDVAAIPQRTGRGRIERIVTFGRFSAHKELSEIVAAAAVLRDRGLAFHLTLIGGGPTERAVRERIAVLSLGDRVTVIPTLPRPELLRALVDQDLFVLASSSEGMPMALLEAMAVGLPVVVANRPYLAGLVSDEEARIYDPSAPSTLADAIEADLKDPGSAEARATRARTLAQAFTWEHVWEEELRLLQAT